MAHASLHYKLSVDGFVYIIGVGRRGGGGGGGGGEGSPNNLRGGQHTIWPPNNPSTFSFNFYLKQEKITNVPS